MAKPGRHKQKYDKYLAAGTRDKNKQIKQQRDAKRKEKFKKRAEAGKTYRYKPNPHEVGTKEYFAEENLRASKNIDHRLPLQKWTSAFRKLSNELAKEEQQKKLKTTPVNDKRIRKGERRGEDEVCDM